MALTPQTNVCIRDVAQLKVALTSSDLSQSKAANLADVVGAMTREMLMVCILVAEDEGDIRTLLVEVLVEAGFQVIEAKTADEAVPLVMQECVRLLLTDIDMPGDMDGIGLACTARQSKPELPVIFITGRPEKLADAKALRDPASFLMKPFSWSTLLSTIDHLSPAA